MMGELFRSEEEEEGIVHRRRDFIWQATVGFYFIGLYCPHIMAPIKLSSNYGNDDCPEIKNRGENSWIAVGKLAFSREFCHIN